MAAATGARQGRSGASREGWMRDSGTSSCAHRRSAAHTALRTWAAMASEQARSARRVSAARATVPRAWSRRMESTSC